MLNALLEPLWTFESVLTEVKSYKNSFISTQHITTAKKTSDLVLLKIKQDTWLKSIKDIGIQEARKSNSALYMWLYRHNKQWLLEKNKVHHNKYIPKGFIINWADRDNQYVKQLINTHKIAIQDINTPRRSKNWLLSQLKERTIIEKNLKKLPLTANFLNKYNESISCYQIRRLIRTIYSLKQDKATLKKWIILRQAGLSNERITTEARRFLFKTLEQQ